MKSSLERRINVASCWASSRVAVLDSHERYEDSYAITQEFREWLICLKDHPEKLDKHLLIAPETSRNQNIDETIDTDEYLEI